MFTYTITYDTTNTYDQPVREAVYQFLILPAKTDDQQLLNKKITHSLSDPIMYSENHYGFEMIRLRTKELFSTFNFKMTCKLKKEKINPFDFALQEEENEQWEMLDALDFQVDHYIFLTTTQRTKMLRSDISELSPETNVSVFEWLIQLNQQVYDYLSFDADSTHVWTTASDAMSGRRGVCQDYVHIFLGVARAIGIPARYTSGYIHQGVGFSGDAQMHAWAEVLIPGVGWKGFDPTNNVLVDHHYIKVAHGVDYDDCSPFKGVLRGVGEQSTLYKVDVYAQQNIVEQ